MTARERAGERRRSRPDRPVPVAALQNERSCYCGPGTRGATLGRRSWAAAQVASLVGLEGLTIGGLAEELELSKSGLFAHFQSKEALQVETLRFGAQLFIDRVIRPALKARRGESPGSGPSSSAGWNGAGPTYLEGGCLFVAASSASSTTARGPRASELVRQQKDWLGLLSTVPAAVTEGHFRSKLDPEQFAHDVYGVMLAWHHAPPLAARPPRRGARAAGLRGARAGRPAAGAADPRRFLSRDEGAF